MNDPQKNNPMGLSIKILKGGSGDVFLVHANDTNILIDGGATMSYVNNLKIEIQKIAQKIEYFDLVIATHFDEDHINGLYKLLEDINREVFPKDLIKKFWFQIPPRITIQEHHSKDTKIGVAKAKQLEILLQEYNWEEKIIISSKTPYQLNKDLKLWILSPNSQSLKKFKDKYQKEWPSSKLSTEENDFTIALANFPDNWAIEDNSKSNGSSIAFILEYKEENKILFLGDARPSVIVESLKLLGYTKQAPLVVDYIKLSHHGSKKSISRELLELTSSKNFIISTNRIKDKQTFAHIVKHYAQKDGNFPISFIFNYEQVNYSNIFSVKDFQDFNFHCKYANQEYGYLVEC